MLCIVFLNTLKSMTPNNDFFRFFDYKKVVSITFWTYRHKNVRLPSAQFGLKMLDVEVRTYQRLYLMMLLPENANF